MIQRKLYRGQQQICIFDITDFQSNITTLSVSDHMKVMHYCCPQVGHCFDSSFSGQIKVILLTCFNVFSTHLLTIYPSYVSISYQNQYKTYT